MLPIKDNKKRRQIALNIAFFYLVFTVLQIVIYCEHLYTVNNFTPEKQYLLQVGVLLDKLLSIVCTVILIIFVIVFIQWFRRAYYNIHITYPDAAFSSEGWAAGAWFVPIISLFRPFNIMRENWLGTLFYVKGREEGFRYYPKNLVLAWWLTYWIYNVFGCIMLRWSTDFASLQEATNYIKGLVIQETLKIISLVFLIIIIKKYAIWEQLQYDKALSDEPAIKNIDEEPVPAFIP